MVHTLNHCKRKGFVAHCLACIDSSRLMPVHVSASIAAALASGFEMQTCVARLQTDCPKLAQSTLAEHWLASWFKNNVHAPSEIVTAKSSTFKSEDDCSSLFVDICCELNCCMVAIAQKWPFK
jgi:hypothetical protein